ncbi:YpiF family protein [Heyndrickxia acidiproducens]|uniref:YpiF family protein n=1 Tax=Heyndrickxia acidiproducens TaxID=1121084 RepID=UPI00036C739B|nr:YpiF family protein [Heyndrickxia acidiproducens]
MLWTAKDIELYLQEQPYIDTAILPLVPASFGREMKQSASQYEWIRLLSTSLENQFKGRLVLMPAYMYLQSLGPEMNREVLQKWESEMAAGGFRHIFYITSDPVWQPCQTSLEGSIIWLPAIPLAHMEQKYRDTVVEEQVKQLISLIVNQWQETL